MSQMTNYLENKLVDHLFRAQTLTAPANLHVSLHTADPTETGAVGEVSGNGYTRGAVASSLVNWAGTQGAGTTVASSGTGGVTSNNGVIGFPTPSGAGWGVVTHFAVWDAATGGNCLLYGSLGTSKTVNSGDAVSFAAGSLTVTFA
jgi:hypothetical protein